MIKYIVHLSDIHVKTLRYHNQYREYFKKFFRELEIKLKDYNHDEIRIVITGDIFHQKINISNEQVILVSWILKNLTKYGIIIIIPGNHDFYENNMERVDSITPIIEQEQFKNKIFYFKNSDIHIDENIVWVVYSLFNGNKRPEFEKEINDKKTYIGLFHSPIQGLSTDLGFKFNNGYDKLNFSYCDIVLAGDIHKRQVFKLPNGEEKGFMVGSFIQQTYEETIKHHGYGLYNVEEDTYTFHDIDNDYVYMKFIIKDIEDIENGKEELINLG